MINNKGTIVMVIRVHLPLSIFSWNVLLLYTVLDAELLLVEEYFQCGIIISMSISLKDLKTTHTTSFVYV